MKIKAACVLALSATAVLAVQPARANVVAYEGFSPSFPIYADGGTGFDGPWVQGGFNAFASGYTPKRESLCFGGQQGGAGRVSGAAFQQINGAIRNLAQALGADGTTLYMSFLLRPEGKLGDGIFSGFFGVTLNGSLGNDLFVGKPGGGALGQYVVETRGGLGQVASDAPAKVGRTALMVLKAQFMSGNDIFTLHVNPRPGVEPTGGAMKTDLDLGAVSRIGIYSTGEFSVDEIRIGTSYADVVPAGSDYWRHDSDECEDGHDR
jgi:hypothetical protein